MADQGHEKMAHCCFAALICITVLAIQVDAASSLTAAEKLDIVKEHNAYRAEVGSLPLVWDDDLGVIAQEWTDHLRDNEGCNLVHRGGATAAGQHPNAANIPDGNGGTASGGWIGENLYGTGGTATPVGATNGWTSEKADWNLGPWQTDTTGNCLSDSGTWYDIGHYSAVVWYSSQRVGCGRTACNGGGEVWACNYYPGGNFGGGTNPYCYGNNPAHVGECPGASAAADPAAEFCTTPSASCDPAGSARCSSPDPCSLTLSWPEVDQAEDGGTKVFTGGLGKDMTPAYKVWLCIEPTGYCAESSGASDDLACFKYKEDDKFFEWFGWNSELGIVAASEYPLVV